MLLWADSPLIQHRVGQEELHGISGVQAQLETESERFLKAQNWSSADLGSISGCSTSFQYDLG